MVLRSLLVTAGVVLSLVLVSPPAHARHDDPDRSHGIRVSGTVWVDENADGIRQPSEPVVPPGVSVSMICGGFLCRGVPTGEGGRYTLVIGTGSLRANVFYFKPGAEPVWTVTEGGKKFTHFGCHFAWVRPDDSELTLDIRLVGYVYDGKASAPPLDWPLADGHLFKQTEGRYRCDYGYSVTNADGIPFWDTWRELGLENVGYPTSSRYVWRGFVTQTFQKAVFQWQPGKGVFFVNVFDLLHDARYDVRLLIHHSTPKQLPRLFFFVDATGKRVEAIDRVTEDKKRRLALLDANPAIRERYYSAPNPLWQYGLPTSKVEDYGNVFVIRTQKAVFQQWKEDVPWAKAGEVTIANGVDVAKELSRREVSDNVEGKIRRIVIHMFSSEEQVRLYQAITDSHYPPSRPLWPCADGPQFTCFPDRSI